jgi:tRNA(Ile2) C34 agmatinyltransferase TiaS
MNSSFVAEEAGFLMDWISRIVSLKHPAPTQCPRCAGLMYAAGVDEYTCLACGEHVFTDPPVARIDLPVDVATDGPRKRGRPRKHPLPVAV